MQIMVYDDADRCGKVEAAHSTPDRYLIAGVSVSYVGREAKGLLPKNQVIPSVHSGFGVVCGGVLAESDQIPLPFFFSL